MKPVLPLAFLFLLLSFVAAHPAPKSTEPPISKEAALKAIAIFREQPQTETGRGAMAIILRFAEESPDVEVRIEPAQMEWMGPKTDLKVSSILLAAYVSGSVRSQLESGKTAHDPLASAEQTIESYRKLQQLDPAIRIAAVEKLIDLKAKGRLETELRTKTP